MRIKEILSQYRRDFYAIYECEGCGHITGKESGYDDRYFHDEVIPQMKCTSCGKSRNDLGVQSQVTETKYHEWMQV